MKLKNQPRKKLRIVGVVPARLGSERLPRKVLRELRGKILIEHVYRRTVKSPALSELWVATDSEEVIEACKKRGIPALMTSDKHPSGTDRIYEVMKQRPADVYVNIQGDEPLARPEHLDALLNPFFTKKSIQVSTLKTKISPELAKSPNVVKVVADREGRALYFSRSIIPFDRDAGGVTGSQASYFKHLGFYAYTAGALEAFHRFSPSFLERTEKLEQLRFLENGVPIFVAETPFDTLGVDTEEDLQRAEELLARELNSRKTFPAKTSISGKKERV